MATVILVIHLLLALSIIALVLLQRSEGGGLGIGGGGGGLGSFATAGQTANALTRTTAICAGLFFTTSIILGILAGAHNRPASMLDSLDNPPPVNGAADAGNADGTKPATMPTDDRKPSAKAPADKDAPVVAPQGDTGEDIPKGTAPKADANIDSGTPKSDKDVPKAAESTKDGPQPQNGAPSAPISE